MNNRTLLFGLLLPENPTMPDTGQMTTYYFYRSDDPVALLPLQAPTNLVATPLSASSIGLEWQDNSDDEAQFYVYRGTTPHGPYAFVASVPAGVTSYTDESLTPLTTYYYRVTAFRSLDDVDSESAQTNEASATAEGALPEKPSNVVAVGLNTTDIDITWDDNSTNEDGFYLYRGLAADDLRRVQTLGAGVTVRHATGLTPGTTYWWAVESFNGAGTSGLTTPVSVTLGSGSTPAYDALFAQGFDAIPTQAWGKSAFDAAYHAPSAKWNTSDSMEMKGGCYVNGVSGATYDNFRIVTTPTRTGSGKAMKVFNRVGDPCDGDGSLTKKSRQEIKFASNFYPFCESADVGDGRGWDHGTETWIGASYYFPSTENAAWWASSSVRMIILQIFGVERPLPTEYTPNSSPIFHFMIGQGGKLDLANAYGLGFPPTAGNELTRSFNNFTTMVPDSWNDFVVQYKKHYLDSQAEMRVWHNGVLKLERLGVDDGLGNAPQKFTGGYFKAGMYRALNEPNDYTCYLDEIRLARGSDLYDVVVPGSGVYA